MDASKPRSTAPSADVTTLEREKLRLEVDNLAHDFGRSLATTLIAAVVTVSIAVGGWLIDRSKTRESEHQARFIAALDKFSNADPAVREAAARELPAYAQNGREGDRVISTLTARLQREDDTGVMQQIISAIQEIGRPALEQTRDANRETLVAFARSCGRYEAVALGGKADDERKEAFLKELDSFVRSLDFPFESEQPTLGIGSHEGTWLFGTREFQAPSERERAAWTTVVGQKRPTVVDVGKARESVAQRWRRLKATSLGVARLIRSLTGKLSGQDLSGVVLIRVNLRDADLSGAKLRNAVIVSTDFINAKFKCANLGGATLMGGIDGDQGRFAGADVTGARFDKDNEPQWSDFDDDVNLWDANWGAQAPQWINQYRKDHERAWKEARKNCPAVAASDFDPFTQR